MAPSKELAGTGPGLDWPVPVLSAAVGVVDVYCRLSTCSTNHVSVRRKCILLHSICRHGHLLPCGASLFHRKNDVSPPRTTRNSKARVSPAPTTRIRGSCPVHPLFPVLVEQSALETRHWASSGIHSPSPGSFADLCILLAVLVYGQC